MKKLLIAACFLCRGAYAQPLTANFENDIQSAVYALSHVMIHDVINPPAAARYYAYCLMGTYEIVSQNDPSIIPLSSVLNGYHLNYVGVDKGKYNYRLASLYCILETGKRLLPSGYMLEKQEGDLLKICKKAKITPAVIGQSVTVAKAMTETIVAYSKTDNYNKLSARLGYTPKKGEPYWDPTPPDYAEAVEPNWKTIHTLIIDSAGEFKPLPLTPFSKDSSSAFYKLAKEVYDISRKAVPEYEAIANFWDNNPFAVQTEGHMMIGFKKISPGGHWMNIAGIAAKRARLSFNQSVQVYTMLSVTMMDAFISAWEEKYRSNRIRPVTYINRYIDVRWVPLLQTPPFPEYISAHSIVSTSAAEILTFFLGDGFSYTDDTEVSSGATPRRFSSFRNAAEEACISRLYGGIHFRDAIVNGQKTGKEVGKLAIQKMKAAGMRPFIAEQKN
ncbi:MAG: vanadium-dependent haloperoxidase [Bacteroidota bacterium]|nr:vanadium-dependent haloperoxidase [Bacteroidota bacterium]MDP4211411.1 vanadium-dependent haloperoxidase [Bacteroidota bacterium]MDP4248638.1 vanadium-dependent haloperoxidase [Bacteroidota bacterium]